MHGAFAKGTQLAQVHPTSAATFETVLSGNGRDAPVIEITTIVLANTFASSVTFRLCHDVDGTVSTAPTALYWDKTIAANDTLIIQGQHPSGGFFLGKNGALRLSVGTASTITCTVYGVTSNVQDRALAGGSN
jgi:allophanate hydrolase subunit 2